MEGRARDPLVDLGERQMKLFSGGTALWKTRSAWDPWQMGVGGRRELYADGANAVARYIARLSQKHTLSSRPISFDRKQTQTPATAPQLSQTQNNILFIDNHDVHRTQCIPPLAYNSRSPDQPQIQETPVNNAKCGNPKCSCGDE